MPISRVVSRGGRTDARPQEFLHHLHGRRRRRATNSARSTINSKIKELTPRDAAPAGADQGRRRSTTPNWSTKAIDALTNAAGTKGYAFAEVHPRITRNRDNHTIDLVFEIEQGPRVYIEKINIVGNTRTLDKVIRREFRLVGRRRLQPRAGRPFAHPHPGAGLLQGRRGQERAGQPARPHRSSTSTVTEQSTGSAVGGRWAIRRTSSLRRRVQLHRAQFVRPRPESAAPASRLRRSASSAQLSFTEPYFLDRPLAAGFDLYKIPHRFPAGRLPERHDRGRRCASAFRSRNMARSVCATPSGSSTCTPSPARRHGHSAGGGHRRHVVARLHLRLQHARRSDETAARLHLRLQPGFRRLRRQREISSAREDAFASTTRCSGTSSSAASR